MNVEFNSGGLQISISSWMHNLSVYFERVLVILKNPAKSMRATFAGLFTCMCIAHVL